MGKNYRWKRKGRTKKGVLKREGLGVSRVSECTQNDTRVGPPTYTGGSLEKSHGSEKTERFGEERAGRREFISGRGRAFRWILHSFTFISASLLMFV